MNLFHMVVLMVGLLLFLGVFATRGYGLYLAYAKGDLIERHLKNCSSYLVHPPYLPSGLRGKITRMGSIAGIFLYARFFIRKGVVSQQDIDNFPADLRRKILAWSWSTLALLGAMAVFAFLIEFDLLK